VRGRSARGSQQTPKLSANYRRNPAEDQGDNQDAKQDKEVTQPQDAAHTRSNSDGSRRRDVRG
jgi:hypothetical protein